MRRFPWLLVLAVVCVVGGCGGSDRDQKGDGEDSARAAADKLPAADRTAFYQLATVDGLIRSRAIVATGHGGLRVSRPDVSEARQRVGGLAPRDTLLAGLRLKLLRGLNDVWARRPGSAQATLAATETVYRGLLNYQRQHPGVVGLVPD